MSALFDILFEHTDEHSKMLIDFCHHCMRSKIKSDKVSFDGFEVTNLLSGDCNLKRKGFLSDHFVKPPVNVTVEFPCNIAIYKIVIDPVIGRQRSCDIKLFSGTKTVSKSWLYGNEDNTPLNSSGLLLNRIGFISSTEPAPICFQNSYFRERGLWKIDNIRDSLQCPIQSELMARKPGSLCNASHLNICVNRVKGSGTAAIKRLEVWGMPAFNVPTGLQQLLLDVFKKAVYPDIGRAHVGKMEHNKRTEAVVVDKEEGDYVTENDVQIPEDYIDQITFEIMAVPMLLPCGKNIDQSTLERFVNTEASWGRAPSDPFTGVLFSPGHQVVPNAALKARLDQFLLRYSDKLKVARTLGSAGPMPVNREMRGSRLVTASESYIKGDFPDNITKLSSRMALKHSGINVEEPVGSNVNIKKRKQTDAHDDTDNAVVRAKRTSFTAMPKAALENRNSSRISESAILVQNRDIGSNTFEATLIDKVDNKSPVKHTSALTDSLDSALNNILSSLPSFTSSREDTLQTTKVMSCSSCDSDLQEDNIVKYKLPCSHYMCRKCVQLKVTSQCKKCNTTFSSVQITRVF